MRRRLIAVISCTVIALILAVEIAAVLQPLPPAKPALKSIGDIVGESVDLPWPAYGQSALGAQGYGLLETRGEQKAAPIASVAKVITALAILEKRPLSAGQPGPTITLGPADVASYQDYVAKGGSVAPVEVGEQISQYQALEGLLLPSANNMAFSLAVWAFGSLENYIAFTNQYVKDMGMTETVVADASGFLPQTVSSARDLVKLANKAMAHPVISQIVAKPQSTIPVAGTIQNTNWSLGSEDIVGIKTGNTDQAGGCFLFAAKKIIDGQEVVVTGAVLNAPDLTTAINASRLLAHASPTGFRTVIPIHSGQVVASYRANWEAKTTAVAKADLSLLVWRTQTVDLKSNIQSVEAGSKAGTVVGSITATAGIKSAKSVVVTQSALASPSIGWRLRHPDF